MMINILYIAQFLFPLLLIQFKWGQVPAFLFLFATSLFCMKNKAYHVKTKIVMLFLFYVCLISMFRFDTILNINSAVDFLWFFVGFFSFSIILTKKDIEVDRARHVIGYAYAIGLLMGLVAISNVASLEMFFEPRYANLRFVSGFDGPNEASAFYLIGYAYSLAQIIEKPKTKQFVLMLWFNVLAASIVIINTWSLAGILGWVIFTTIIMVNYGFKKRQSVMKWLSVMVSITAIFSFLIIRIYPLYSLIRHNQTDRSEMYITLLQYVRDYNVIELLFGRGFYSYSQYGKTAHNEAINILLSGGIISVIILFTLLLFVISISIRKKMFPEMYVFLVFLTQEATFNHIVRGRVSMVFWIIVILTVCSSSTGNTAFTQYMRDKRKVLST